MKFKKGDIIKLKPGIEGTPNLKRKIFGIVGSDYDARELLPMQSYNNYSQLFNITAIESVFELDEDYILDRKLECLK